MIGQLEFSLHLTKDLDNRQLWKNKKLASISFGKTNFFSSLSFDCSDRKKLFLSFPATSQSSSFDCNSRSPIINDRSFCGVLQLKIDDSTLSTQLRFANKLNYQLEKSSIILHFMEFYLFMNKIRRTQKRLIIYK